MSPRKVRLVLDLVRDKYVDEALAILSATPNRAARVVEKLVRSAAANAENNLQISREELKVKGAYADQGPTLKRIQPRAMGRAYRILKRSSHVTVVVEETEARPSTRRLARTVTKADARGRGRKKEAKLEAKAKLRQEQAQAAEPEQQVEETAAVEQEQAAVAEAPAEQAVAEEAPAAEESQEDTSGDEAGASDEGTSEDKGDK